MIITMLIHFFNKTRGKLVRPFLVRNKFFVIRQVAKFDPSKDYYQILQLSKEASDAQIKHAYYKLAKIYHPDVSSGKQLQFKEVTEAYSVLSHQDIKKQYIEARLFKQSNTVKKAPINRPSSKIQKKYKDMTPEQKVKFLEQSRNKMWMNLVFLVCIILISLIPPQKQTSSINKARETTVDQSQSKLLLKQQQEEQVISSYEYVQGQNTNSLLIGSQDQVIESFLLPDYSKAK